MNRPNKAKTGVRKPPSGWSKLWSAVGIGALVFFLMTVVSIVGLAAQTKYQIDENVVFAGIECCAGFIAFLFVILLGGWKLARPSLKGMGEAWKAAIWLFAVDGALLGVGIVEMIIGVEPFELATDWPVRVAIVAVLCLGVGMLEESLTRGILLNGLLARMGRTRAGVYGAVILSSIAFGMLHFDPFIDFSDGLQAAQNIMKVVQTGMCGFFFAAIVIKTRNLWTAISIHAINDFMLMFISNGLMPEAVSTEYVATGEDGISILVVYVIISLLYIPLIVMGKRFIDQASPWRGAFYHYKEPPVAEAVSVAPQGANVHPGSTPLAAPAFAEAQAGMAEGGRPGLVNDGAFATAPVPMGTTESTHAAPPAYSSAENTSTRTAAPAGTSSVLKTPAHAAAFQLQVEWQDDSASLEMATAKAMRGKHAARPRANNAEGTPNDQGF